MKNILQILRKSIFLVTLCIIQLVVLFSINAQAQCTYGTKMPAATQTPPSDGTLYGPIASATARFFQATVVPGVEYIVYDTYADFLTVWGTSNGTGLLGTETQYVFFTPTGNSVWIDFAYTSACPSDNYTLDAYIAAAPQPTGIPSGVVCIGQTITITGTALAGSGGANYIGFTGGATATAFNVTATSLDVVIPAGAQSGPITVQNDLVISTTASSLDIRTATGVTSSPTAGGIGDNIVISGYNLLGATNVRVNGTLATNVVIVSSTKITCTVAPGTVGSGNVTFTDGCGNAVTASAFTVVALTNYYSKAAGYLNLLATWGINLDGSGAAPANFTTQGQRFNIRNRTTATIGAAWTVSGAGAGVNVGDGTNPCNFTVPSNFTFSGNVININSNATLTLNRNPLPTLTFCTCAPTSTVVIGVTNASITVPGITYGNLTISAAAPTRIFTFGGNSTIAGTLTVSTTGTVRLNNASTPKIFYINNFVMSNGTLDGGSVDPSSGNYSSITYFTGNFSKTAGTITNSSPSSINNFLFSGGGSQTFSNTGTYLYNVTQIINNTTLILNSTYTQDGITGTAFYVENGSTLECGTNQLTTSASPVTFDIEGTLKTANTAGLNGTALTTLSSTNSPTIKLSSSSTIEYNSSSPQTVTGRSDYANLIISNGSTKTANNPLTVSGVLTLNGGNLVTTSTNLLTMAAGSSVSPEGGSATSFVDGPIAKVGNTAFIFPTGNGTTWARIAIGTPSASETFTAQYFHSGYGDYTVTQIPNTIDHVSKLEYWTLSRAGTANATVQLFSENASTSYITSCSDLRIAHWNGSAWENNNDEVTTIFGTCPSPLTTESGSIKTNTNVTSFSPFTFGSKIGTNPLPVEFYSFNGTCSGNKNIITWQTASESNNYGFYVQKSNDASYWENVSFVNGHGNSNTLLTYQTEDGQPFEPTTYYRLLQVDNNGESKYSTIISVQCPSQTADESITPFYSDENRISFAIKGQTGITYHIYLTNYLGQVLYEKNILLEQTNQTIIIEKPLSSGIYYITLISNKSVISKPMMIQKN